MRNHLQNLLTGLLIGAYLATGVAGLSYGLESAALRHDAAKMASSRKPASEGTRTHPARHHRQAQATKSLTFGAHSVAGVPYSPADPRCIGVLPSRLFGCVADPTHAALADRAPPAS